MLYRTGNHLRFSTRPTVVLLVALATLLLDFSPALAGCSSPAFGPPVTFPVGANPASITTGDFNGDGKLDIAVANQYCSETNQICDSISVLLGNGAGTFLPASNYAAGPYPQAIATGDFNGDNKLDLVVANSTDPGTVSILLGNGNGSFQSPIAYGTGSTPGAVVVGDFNHDNRLDLVVANFINSVSGSISVLLGKGDGSFYTKTNYAAGKYPESLAVGDFNEDNNLDLAVARESGVVVLLGNSNGTFQSATTIASATEPESVTVGDFNQDGHADIAVVQDTSPGSILVLRGLGNGSFQPATNYATGPYPLSLESSDYNGDGRPDFAVGDDTGISVLLGTSNGTFQITSGFGSVTNSYFLTTGDFNGDGAPDLAAANYQSNGIVSLLLNACVSAAPNSAVLLKSPFRQGNGLFHFTIFSPAGAVLVVAASTNLTAWTQIAVVTNVTGTMDFTDPASASFSRRFYHIGIPVAASQPMTVAGMTRLADGNIQFNVLGTDGQIFRVLANTNLSTTNWITVANLTNGGGSQRFTDTTATNFLQRFYRMVSP